MSGYRDTENTGDMMELNTLHKVLCVPCPGWQHKPLTIACLDKTGNSHRMILCQLYCMGNRQADRESDGRTERQADRQTDRQTDRQIDSAFLGRS